MKNFILGLALFALAASTAQVNAGEVQMGDDGLHKQAWFSDTFKDIAEDIATAKEEGKRLAIIFEQRGCIYCKEVHENVLSDPEVRDYLKENFMMVQFNLHGDVEITDTDGEVLSEKKAARKWRLLFTPTVLFLPEDPPQDKSAVEAAVAIMPGAFKKFTFLEMFIWVNEKGYESDEGFQTYFNRKFRERQEAKKKASN